MHLPANYAALRHMGTAATRVKNPGHVMEH